MGVSRREFLKGAATASAAGVAAASTSIAVADDAESKAPDFVEFFAESRAEWEPIPEDQIAETYDYDYVVIGAGAAGVTSALAAGDKGVGRVALLQNAYAAISNGTAAGGIDLEKSDPVALGLYKQAWNKMNVFSCDQNMLDNIVNYSGEAIKFVAHWAHDMGGEEPNGEPEQELEYDGAIVVNHLLDYGPKPRTFAACVQAMASVADQCNVDVYYGMPGVQLVQDETGRVVAAIGKSMDDDKYYRFNATKGVMLACGSYHCNLAMLARYNSNIVDFDSKVEGYLGDGHLMGMLAGGYLRNSCHSQMVHDNDNPMQNVPFLGVNDNGERFMNEDCDNRWVYHILRDQPNPGWWSSIFDANYQEEAANMSAGSGHMTSADGAVFRAIGEEEMRKYMPGTPENEALGVFGALGRVYKADTLEELAEQLEIPAENLVASVARYNELYEKGIDEDFGKRPAYLTPIVTPPFWGVRRHQRISCVLSGLVIDKYMRVLNKNGEVIPGLYSAGNNAGDTCGAVDWQQPSGGASLGNAITGGYVAALHVAGVIGE